MKQKPELNENGGENNDKNKRECPKPVNMGLSYWERVGAGAIGGAIVAIAVTNYHKIVSILGPSASIIATVLAIFAGVLIIFYGRYGELPF